MVRTIVVAKLLRGVDYCSGSQAFSVVVENEEGETIEVEVTENGFDALLGFLELGNKGDNTSAIPPFSEKEVEEDEDGNQI